jgi:hypothetical protein
MTDRQERIADTAKKKLDMYKVLDQLQELSNYLRIDKLNNDKINAQLVRKYSELINTAVLRNIEQTKALISVYDGILNNLITSKDND